jgi:hypothetical protein
MAESGFKALVSVAIHSPKFWAFVIVLIILIGLVAGGVIHPSDKKKHPTTAYTTIKTKKHTRH